MASSLDEIQSYDLFQTELENALDEYIEKVEDVLFISYIINVFIEFVSFNKFLDDCEQLDQQVITEFEEWLPYYNQEVDGEKALIEVKGFLTFFNNRSLKS